MTTIAATDVFPHIDATKQDCLTDEQAQFFRDNGLLVIRNLLRGAELKAMQDQTLPLVQRAMAERVNDPDYAYGKHEITGKTVPTRIEFVVDKTPAGKVLAGHPFILKSVEKLQGRNFVPTWDSMVFKIEGQGPSVPWHRDGGTERREFWDHQWPIFNVDFYLDGSDLSNCVWGILGSNRWTADEAMARMKKLNEGGFHTDEDCVPMQTNPGDVLFHNILALHGSPPAQSKLRRVVYYEYRPAEIETEFGPHTPEYVPLKQKVLLACLRDRARASYVKGETPFVYRPDAKFAAPALGADEQLTTYRYPHGPYWRKLA